MDRNQIISIANGLKREAAAVMGHDIQRAIELEERALELFRSISYERAVIATLLALARSNMGAKRYEQSRSHILEAQRLNQLGGQHADFDLDIAAALAELAFYQSRHEEALALFKQVITKARLQGRNEYIVISASFLMDIYYATRDFDAIIQCYEGTVENAIQGLSTQRAGNPIIIRRAENNCFLPYISTLLERARFDEAEQKARNLISRIRGLTGTGQATTSMEADAVNLLGTVYHHRWKQRQVTDSHTVQHLHEAERLYREAFEILKSEDRGGAAWFRIIFNLALIAEEKEQYTESRHLHTQLIEISRQKQYRASLAASLTHRGKANLRLGDYGQAGSDLIEAVQLSEDLRSGTLASEAQRVAYQQVWNYPYQYAVEALLKLGGHESETVTILEKNKSRSLVEQIARTVISPPPSIPKTLVQSEQDLTQSIGRLAANLSNPAKSPAELLKLTQELQTANASLSRIYDSMAETAPDYVAMRRGQAYDFKMIHDLLAEEAAQAGRPILVVEYFITEIETFVIGIRSDWDVPRVEKVPVSEADLQKYLNEFHKQLDRPDLETAITIDPDALDAALGALIDPVCSWCRPDTLVCLVPHKFLNELPLHAVRYEGKPFAEHFDVFYNWSATLLLNAARKRKVKASRILIAADADTAKRAPMARYQAYAVAEKFTESLTFVGETATKAQIEGALEKHHEGIDVLLFGVHGTFASTSSEKESDQTRLELYGENLLVKDIMLWRSNEIRAGLVTLSACESGRNESLLGDELMGLTRAFMYGTDTPSVIVSMWKADDLATCIVMIKFYELWLQGSSKARTLQQAIATLRTATRMQILDLLQNARARLIDDPDAVMEIDSRIQQFRRVPDGYFNKLGFWSTFILVGDWK